MTELDVARAFDFDWAVRLDDVWTNPAWDVPELHAGLRREFDDRLDRMMKNPHRGSPLGWVFFGPGGAGKTHLLGQFRRSASAKKCAFVLVDMTDVRDFWDTVLQGYIGSLETPYGESAFQHQVLLGNLIGRMTANKPVAQVLRIFASRRSEELSKDVQAILGVLAKTQPVETRKYQDVVRALVCLNSTDFAIASLGSVWLRGSEVDEADRRALGFTRSRAPAIEVVEALSWLMSLCGPTVLAFDQLDAIVAQANAASRDDPGDDAQRRVSREILQQIGGGLAALHTRTSRTLTVLSCLEASWAILEQEIPAAFLARFEVPPRKLDAVPDRAIAESIVRGRLEAAYRLCEFEPPYPTWPFRPEAFESLKASTPREILMVCEKRRREWLSIGQVTEVGPLDPGPGPGPGPGPTGTRFDLLDKRFAHLKSSADPAHLIEEKHEDERLAPLLQSALQCLAHEADLPTEIGAVVDRVFTGGEKTRPLHARLRLVFASEGDREEHFCLRALQYNHAGAFQSRLKAAMTTSGIDRSLKFRRLSIVRTTDTPGGAMTLKLIQDFLAAGGQFLRPSDDELRTLHALHEMQRENDPDLRDWLRARRPASSLPILRAAVPSPHIFQGGGANGSGAEPTATPTKPDARPKPPEDKPKDPAPPVPIPVATEVPPSSIAIGRRTGPAKAGEPLALPVKLLEKHTLVIAGSGSGKTVLLRRMIEEAALRGVPSIVVDIANDLVTLGDRWPSAPEGWWVGDEARAARFHAAADVVVWTPAREGGNPLALEPMPDLRPLVGDSDELEAGVAMVGEALEPLIASGKSAAANSKRGLLTSALKAYARGDEHGGLTGFLDYLRELPPEAGLGIKDEGKLTRQMADGLAVAMATSPMLRSEGRPLDPALLFGTDLPLSRTRISVVNLNVGLPTLEGKRQFLNQLAMTLFAWVKRNPDPAPRPLRGLLVIDEARDFLPGTAGSACKESLIRLAAQARKYHLGLVFATQNPKDVDHRVVANCATHFYGKVNSPASIAAVRSLIEEKGGSGEDVAKLPKGQFFAHNAELGLTAPARIAVPLCLSRVAPNTPDEADVIRRAAAGRAAIATSTH